MADGLGLSDLGERLLVALRLDQFLRGLQGLADLRAERFLGLDRAAAEQRRGEQHRAGGAAQVPPI